MIKPAAGLGGIMVAACMLLVACRNVTPTAQSEQASALFETMQAMTTPVQAVVLPTELATQAISSGPVLQSPEETSAATTTPGNEAASPTSLPTAPAITLVPPAGFVVYITKPGETLRRLADRFELRLDALIVQQPFPPDAYLPEGLQLIMPEIHNAVTPPDSLLPDSELVYSPSAVDFDTAAFVNQAGGFLSTYVENVDGQNMSGAEIVQRVANELSVNPRLLLAVLEERSGWVYGQPKDPNRVDYPIGFMATGQVGLYDELRIAGTQLNLAYYGYKEGSYILIRFANGSALRLHPFMNPGTAGLHNLFAMFYTPSNWWQKLAGINGFMALYQDMFGDPWARAAAVEPLIPYDLTQPVLELPFPPGEYWSFTSGPHWAWNYGTPRGALDFAPANNEERCEVSKQWATASAAGVIARAANNAVALDLDRDGLEQTGWVLVYLHLAGEGLIQPGIHVQVDDPLGHPSCQGGSATGTHVHLARKFNGEWLDAEWLAPFVLSGYQVRGNGINYQGELVNGDLTIAACPYGCKGALIKR